MKDTDFRSRFPSAADSPGFLLWKAANLHQRLQRLALSPLAISPTQFSVLACFFHLSRERGGPVSQAEVAEYASLDKMVVSDAARALLSKGLILRRRSQADGRAFQIELTGQGVETCNQALAIIEATDAGFFSRSGDVQTVLQLLKRLTDVPAREEETPQCSRDRRQA